MAITPPSDLIMDVARAADPQRMRAAAAKLDARAVGASDFAALIESKSGSSPSAANDGPVGVVNAGRPAPHAPSNAQKKPQTQQEATGEAWRSLNALLVQKMIEQATPENSSSSFGFGKGFAGQAWKSLMAEHVAKAASSTLFPTPQALGSPQDDKKSEDDLKPSPVRTT